MARSCRSAGLTHHVSKTDKCVIHCDTRTGVEVSEYLKPHLFNKLFRLKIGQVWKYKKFGLPTVVNEFLPENWPKTGQKTRLLRQKDAG
jgi:hypothetical protein